MYVLTKTSITLKENFQEQVRSLYSKIISKEDWLLIEDMSAHRYFNKGCIVIDVANIIGGDNSESDRLVKLLYHAAERYKPSEFILVANKHRKAAMIGDGYGYQYNWELQNIESILNKKFYVKYYHDSKSNNDSKSKNGDQVSVVWLSVGDSLAGRSHGGETVDATVFEIALEKKMKTKKDVLAVTCDKFKDLFATNLGGKTRAQVIFERKEKDSHIHGNSHWQADNPELEVWWRDICMVYSTNENLNSNYVGTCLYDVELIESVAVENNLVRNHFQTLYRSRLEELEQELIDLRLQRERDITKKDREIARLKEENLTLHRENLNAREQIHKLREKQKFINSVLNNGETPSPKKSSSKSITSKSNNVNDNVNDRNLPEEQSKHFRKGHEVNDRTSSFDVSSLTPISSPSKTPHGTDDRKCLSFESESDYSSSSDQSDSDSHTEEPGRYCRNVDNIPGKGKDGKDAYGKGKGSGYYDNRDRDYRSSPVQNRDCRSSPPRECRSNLAAGKIVDDSSKNGKATPTTRRRRGRRERRERQRRQLRDQECEDADQAGSHGNRERHVGNGERKYGDTPRRRRRGGGRRGGRGGLSGWSPVETPREEAGGADGGSIEGSSGAQHDGSKQTDGKTLLEKTPEKRKRKPRKWKGDSEDPVCWDYVRKGRCIRGARCKYYHLNADQIPS